MSRYLYNYIEETDCIEVIDPVTGELLEVQEKASEPPRDDWEADKANADYWNALQQQLEGYDVDGGEITES